MNFLKRAFTSIARNLGKTLTLLLLVFILGTAMAGALAVEGAINNTNDNLRQNMQPLATISLDWDAHNEAFGDVGVVNINNPISMQTPPEHLTPTIVREVGSLPYVSFYDYTIRRALQSFTLEPFIGDEQSIEQNGTPNFISLIGTSNAGDEIVQLQQEVITLVEGRTFSEDEVVANFGEERSVALVSQLFATHNNLSLNSTFNLYQLVLFPREDGLEMEWTADSFVDENIYAKVSMEFEVVGIFDVVADADADVVDWQKISQSNIIYVPNWTLEDIMVRVADANVSVWDAVDFDSEFAPQMASTEEIAVIPLFVLNDATEIEDFRVATTELIPEFHVVEDLSSTFAVLATSLVTLQEIANWILFASIGATLLILSLLIMLFLRDRCYEMGVYLALGEKKAKVVWQILLEVVVIAFTGTTLAIFAGNIISDVVSRQILNAQLLEQFAERGDMWELKLESKKTTKKLSKINVLALQKRHEATKMV